MQSLRYGSVVAMILAIAAATWADEPRIKFNRDIRPILSDTCFTCHGPDSGKVEAGLRLDLFASATAKLDSGETAIVPGKPDASELIRRIVSTDADLHMPPAKSGKVLTPAQIATLKQWVAEGAKYEGHWAFIAPVRPEVPATAPTITNLIDKFIRARLATSGMHPAPQADKATLLRRATLDLTGLPPTIAEMDAFLADNSPQAYERVVDRLLMSPAYGERMALPWLDYARYADSNGFQSDGSRDIWGWRDWVINAFNRNQPFDQFTIEQLAGDMLPNATSEQIIATGFNRNHRLNGEGGRIVEEWFVETVIDRVETTGLTWLGLTVNCCRCHDHKYDPISQKEFFQLFAYFNSVDESGVLSPAGKNGENTPPLFTMKTPADDAKLAELAAITLEKEDSLAAAKKDLTSLQAAWETKLRESLTNAPLTWQVMAKVEVKSLAGGATFQQLDDSSWLPGGKNPANDVYEFKAAVAKGSTLSGILVETIPDASMPNQSLGRASNGNYVLTGVAAEIVPATGAAQSVEFARIAADYEQPNWPAAAILNNRDKSGKGDLTGWAVNGNDPDKRLTRKLLLVAKEPLKIAEDATLKIVFRHESMHAQHNIGRFRVSTSSAPTETLGLEGNAIPQGVHDALLVDTRKRTAAQKKLIEKYFLDNSSGGLKAAQDAVAKAKLAEKNYREDLPTTMVMKEIAPRQAFLLKRGEYDQPGEKVSRGLPAFLPPLPAGVANDRLGFAKWIVHDSNPLTARVWVNRQWEKFFGTGLVKTAENFGSQAEFPSHPDLLDWLACEFMQPTVSPAVNGVPAQRWDMKALQKLIVMSETYQQSSHVTAATIARDPDNRLLSHGPRFRLTGELIRDQALAVSGLLVDKIGGPSVRPYMPPNVWDETSKYGNLRGYKNDKGEGLYRRTMYTIWKRTAAPPTMLLFDAPNREICTIKRSKTNTPLQALSLLNEVTFVEAARKLGERMLKEGGASPEQRIEYGFRLAVGRRPTATELKVLADGLTEDLKRFTADEAAAKKLANVGEAKANAALPPAELAAYALTANVLLNLDEFVTKE
ncbi:Planctomycete cytochrome C [Anatilimnocola aggregata]|uniref:Planctomycete cytochrome C n=1 Tax=Anatilimnocola aggregata TaxID=2528021 RepID=A0A517YG94_9BACT|nr:PSD1 and planctomycete cytochrome C domain-containing protein [Anatilimnocola aggregata]QDU29239.1 Planctomycete cytochrome C [Anatilimnocola aggregata]